MCCEKMNRYKCSDLCAKCQENRCGCRLCPYEEYEEDCPCQRKRRCGCYNQEIQEESCCE
ncbi:MAG: hypothetical protein RR497_02710 [Oscillospiraceae bacterium]